MPIFNIYTKYDVGIKEQKKYDILKQNLECFVKLAEILNIHIGNVDFIFFLTSNENYMYIVRKCKSLLKDKHILWFSVNSKKDFKKMRLKNILL